MTYAGQTDICHCGHTSDEHGAHDGGCHVVPCGCNSYTATYLRRGWCVAGFTHVAPRMAMTHVPLPHMDPLVAPLCLQCDASVKQGQGNLSGLIVPTHLLLMDYDVPGVQS